MFMPMVQGGISLDGGYIIEGSGLFDGSSGYLTRTPGSTGDEQTWTFECVFKRSKTYDPFVLYMQGADTNNRTYISFRGGGGANDRFECGQLVGSSSSWGLETTQLFRDIGSYYHLVVAVDTTQATSTDRVNIYVNGTQITDLSLTSYPSLNLNTDINTTDLGRIGSRNTGLQDEWNGYIARATMIDGLQLAPTSFGEVTDDGFWQINDASGLTFGTNGFLIEGGSAISAGTDSSGNSNNFSKTGTITATNDSPTNDADNEYGNYTVFDAGNTRHINAAGTYKASGTISNGNRTVAANMASDAETGMTILLYPGQKYHVEWTLSSFDGSSVDHMFLRLHPASTWRSVASINTNSYYLRFSPTGSAQPSERFFKNSSQGTTNRWNNGDRMSWDIDMSTIGATDIIIKNDGSTEATESNLAFDDEPYMLSLGSSDATRSCIVTMNNGSEDFSDTPVAGHLGISTANSPTPAPINYEDEYYIEAGISHSNGSTTAVTLPKTVSGGAMVRIKRTNTTGDWYVFDTVRGANKFFKWNSSTVEDTSTFDDQNLTGTTLTLPSDLASGTYLVEVFYVGSYFQIAEYTGNTTNRTETYATALDTAPGFFVLLGGPTTNENVAYHTSLGATKGLAIDSNIAAQTVAVWFNNTEPTTTGFTIGTSATVNANSTSFTSYHWANSGPYSFGSYTGNGNTDGPVVNVGGGPQFLFRKNSGAATFWSTTSPQLNGNEVNSALNLSDTQALTADAVSQMDFLSTGFKTRDNGSEVHLNSSGATYVYGAFGIQPLTDSAINQGRAK